MLWQPDKYVAAAIYFEAATRDDIEFTSIEHFSIYSLSHLMVDFVARFY